MTTPARPTVSDLRLERYRLGELPPGEMRDLEARLALDPTLRARLEALRQSDADIAARHPTAAVVAAIRQRAGAAVPEPRRRWSSAWLVPAAAAALIVLAVVVPAVRRAGDASDDERVKGNGPSLVVYRRVPGGSERIESGSRARQGDQVRLAYRADGRGYGAILSVDRAGSVTCHMPTTGTTAARLQPNGAVMLDSSYELDAAAGWERFYFITGTRPFDLDSVMRALRDTASRGSVSTPPTLSLATGLEQFVFTLAKDDRP